MKYFFVFKSTNNSYNNNIITLIIQENYTTIIITNLCGLVGYSSNEVTSPEFNHLIFNLTKYVPIMEILVDTLNLTDFNETHLI